jgi:hypothetical protein
MVQVLCRAQFDYQFLLGEKYYNYLKTSYRWATNKAQLLANQSKGYYTYYYYLNIAFIIETLVRVMVSVINGVLSILIILNYFQ